MYSKLYQMTATMSDLAWFVARPLLVLFRGKISIKSDVKMCEINFSNFLHKLSLMTLFFSWIEGQFFIVLDIFLHQILF